LAVRSEIQAPQILLNGVDVAGAVLDYEVDTEGASTPSRFSVRLARGALPAARSFAWMAGRSDMQVEIRRAAGRSALILGDVDRLGLAPFEDEVTLAGRDLTGRLADAPARSAHKNRTAADIIREIAEGHGLSCAIEGGEALAGLVYQVDHAKLSLERSEWDLISGLARANGLRAQVAGRALTLTPLARPASVAEILVCARPTPGGLTPLGLRLDRDQRLSGEVTFEVESFHARTGRANRWTAKASGSSETPPLSARRLAARAVGLDGQQTRARAEQLLTEVMGNEIRLSARFDFSAVVDPQARIRLAGFGAPFDRAYQPLRVAWRWSSNSGGMIELDARSRFSIRKEEP
jgi:prophage tail gpP-like protein